MQLKQTTQQQQKSKINKYIFFFQKVLVNPFLLYFLIYSAKKRLTKSTLLENKYKIKSRPFSFINIIIGF